MGCDGVLIDTITSGDLGGAVIPIPERVNSSVPMLIRTGISSAGCGLGR
jgi:hypothetical protein